MGHGLRTRRVRGALRAGEEAVERIVFVRRFRCRDCCAVITVVPREVAPGRLYGAAAIALALVLFGVHRLPAEKVLQRLKPACARGHDRRRWRVLDRWLSAIRGRRLFPRLRVAPSAETSSARSAAAFFARQLGAFSRQLGGPIEETAVDGAMMALVA